MKKQISIFITLSLCTIVLFSYQNCGTDSASGNSLFSKSNEFPPPYDVKVNQVAYMSCSEQKDVPNTDGVFFTFRAGAYGNTAGIRLSDDFLYATRREDDFDRRDILGTDESTVMTRLQFAMRQPNLLSRMFVNADSNEGIEEQDYDFVFGDLGSDEMSASIISLDPGTYMSYWAAGGITKDAYFSTTLVFNGSEALAETVRQSLASRTWALTFGFADPMDPVSLRTIDDFYGDENSVDGGDGSSGGTSGGSSGGSSSGGDNGDSVQKSMNTASEDDEIEPSSNFGVGLRVEFKKPAGQTWGLGNTHANMPHRVLKSVSDFDLSSPGSNKMSWNCPTTLQFRIIHPGDLPNDALCAKVHDPAVPSDLLKIVRRSLPASDWFVNLAQQCVIPRKSTEGSCYGIDQGLQVRRTPVYGFSAKCNPAMNASGTGVCSHFVSICVRPE